MSQPRLVRAIRDKALADYLRRCQAAGFTLTIDGTSHIRVTAPDGRWERVSGSQYSGAATLQAISRIRAIGGPTRHKEGPKG